MLARWLPTIVFSLVIVTPSPILAIEANSADDVCAPDADPCVITDVVEVAPLAVLDFGVRRVELIDKGRLVFGRRGGTVSGGSFRATSDGVAIAIQDSRYFTGVVIEARRACSDAVPEYPCLTDARCNLGPCDTRYCENSETRTCYRDSDCQLGSCVESTGRCSNALFVECVTNSDCQLGSCAPELACADSPQGKRACSANADCALGTCSLGEGSIDIESKIDGRTSAPGYLEMVAADAVTLSGPINLSSRHRDFDGGWLDVYSFQGGVRMTGRFRSRSGRWGWGGLLGIQALEDVFLGADVNVQGGDSDGGTLDLWSHAGDVIVHGDILADSRSGSGVGGYVELLAGRDVVIAPGPDSASQLLSLNGHRSSEGDGGEGGDFDLRAGRDVSIAEGVTMRSRGAAIGGYGGRLFVEADGNAVFDGSLEAVAPGPDTRGGYAGFEVVGRLELGPDSRIDVSARNGRGGQVRIESGDAVVAGGIASDAAPSLQGSELIVDSSGDLIVSGVSVLGSGADSIVDLEACRITLTGTASVTNESDTGDNRLTAHESMRLEAGSMLLTSHGANVLEYRTSAKPPAVEGVVDPAPELIVNESLLGCPECGNSEVDQTETCDDGNVADGDGCSGQCLIE